MDTRRLDTAGVLAMGILKLPPPSSAVPIEFDGQHVEEWEWTEEGLEEGLRTGGVTASMYYGCWDIWQTEQGYDGQLMQYRAITDQFQNQPLEFALRKAVEWAQGCQG